MASYGPVEMPPLEAHGISLKVGSVGWSLLSVSPGPRDDLGFQTPGPLWPSPLYCPLLCPAYPTLSWRLPQPVSGFPGLLSGLILKLGTFQLSTCQIRLTRRGEARGS